MVVLTFSSNQKAMARSYIHTLIFVLLWIIVCESYKAARGYKNVRFSPLRSDDAEENVQVRAVILFHDLIPSFSADIRDMRYIKIFVVYDVIQVE